MHTTFYVSKIFICEFLQNLAEEIQKEISPSFNDSLSDYLHHKTYWSASNGSRMKNPSIHFTLISLAIINEIIFRTILV